ncbi:MAG: hypothetical protein IRZ16_07885 [Myxococcaceae bacterium]|nr:hypothetical protein [Myxococcaceae bacterium]
MITLRVRLAMLVAFALPLAVGCTSSIQTIRKTALNRAAFDLNCPESSLTATQLGDTTHVGRSKYSYGAERTVIGVQGCGQKAVYVVECSQPDVCNAQLNADTQKDASAAR